MGGELVEHSSLHREARAYLMRGVSSLLRIVGRQEGGLRRASHQTEGVAQQSPLAFMTIGDVVSADVCLRQEATKSIHEILVEEADDQVIVQLVGLQEQGEIPRSEWMKCCLGPE